MLTESRRANIRYVFTQHNDARVSYQMGRGIFKERTNSATFSRRVRCRERECAKAVFPAARAGGIQVWVHRVCAYICIYTYFIRDIPQLLTILRLKLLLDLLATSHHRLVELLLHDVTATSGHSTTCRRPPVDLLRLIPGRASLNTGSRTLKARSVHVCAWCYKGSWVPFRCANVCRLNEQ